jgi:hypothetical protein
VHQTATVRCTHRVAVSATGMNPSELGGESHGTASVFRIPDAQGSGWGVWDREASTEGCSEMIFPRPKA